MTKPDISPRRWTPPPACALPAPTPPVGMRSYAVSGYGPEDVNLLPDGRIITGLVDGRLIAIDPDTGTEEILGRTGGRPLGIEIHPAGGFVVCDAYKGLLHFHPDTGDVEVLATEFQGRPFLFCNNAAVASDGTIYFTDSSAKFDFPHWRGDLLEHDPTGRLYRRTPDGGITLILDGLAFANGVALAADGSFVVVAETAGYSLRRCWLTGARAGEIEDFGVPLNGFPDNISTGEDGNIWVAIASPRDSTLDVLLPKAPFVRKLIWSLPQRFQPQPKSLVQVQAFDAEGRVVVHIDGSHPSFGKATGVRQVGDTVWLGSFETESIAVMGYGVDR